MKNKNINIVATLTVCLDIVIGIESIEYGVNDVVCFRWYHSNKKWDKLHRAKIRYTTEGRPYFISYKQRWYLDEAIRTNSTRVIKEKVTE